MITVQGDYYLKGTKKHSETSTHKQLKQKVADKLFSEGYKVELEKTVDGRRVDVYAENENEIKIVEIVHTHDGRFPQIESNKRIRKVKVYTLNHFRHSRTPIISFSVKSEYKWMIDCLKEYAMKRGMSFSEVMCEVIEECYNDLYRNQIYRRGAA